MRFYGNDKNKPKNIQTHTYTQNINQKWVGIPQENGYKWEKMQFRPAAYLT